MIFYKKRLKTPPVKKFYFAFDDFSGGMNSKKFGDISTKYAEVCFNTDGEYGAFKQGLGFDLPDINASVFIPPAKQICCFCMDGQDFLAVVNQSDQLMVLPVNGNEWQVVSNVKGRAKLLSYRQKQKVVLLVFDDNGLSQWDGAQTTLICSNPLLDDVVVYFDRVFGIDKNDNTLLRFCTQLNPAEWTDKQGNTGYILLNDNFGKITKLALLDNLLYVFGEQKIAKIQATASPQEIVVQKIYTLNGKIKPNTIQVCGDKIMFLCDDGLYIFDGNNTTKVCDDLQNNFKDSQNASCFFNTKYYLACKMDFCDGRRICCENDVFNNNVLIEYDLQKQKTIIARGVDISCLTCAKDNVFFVADGKIGQVSDSGNFFGKQLEKVWESAFGDFDICGKKVIKSVQLHTITSLVIKIWADGRLYAFNVNGNKNLQKLKLGVVGEIFKICFETTSSKPFVFKPVFEVVYGG